VATMVPFVLCPGAGLEQANRKCRASWEGCNTRSASAGCSARIPQCHTHNHVIGMPGVEADGL